MSVEIYAKSPKVIDNASCEGEPIIWFPESVGKVDRLTKNRIISGNELLVWLEKQRQSVYLAKTDMLYPRCRKPLSAITHAPQPSHAPVTSFRYFKSSCDHWDYRGFPQLLSDRHIQNMYHYEEITSSNALRSPLPKRVSQWRHSASNALRVRLPKYVSLWRHRSLKCCQMTTARTNIIMKTLLHQMPQIATAKTCIIMTTSLTQMPSDRHRQNV